MKTSEPVVVTIFGSERCVAALEDLEAAAKAIHAKALCESETSATPSTLGSEIEGQISLLNAESDPSETPASKS